MYPVADRTRIRRGESLMTVTQNNRSPCILVADDHSLEARAAASTACQIAQHLNLTIRGLYVVDEGLALDTYANYRAELPDFSFASNGNVREPTSRAELMAWFETRGKLALHWLEAACTDAGVPLSTKLLAGGVTELVIRDAAEAQLLAIGRRGNTHRNNATSLGHNFHKIAHHVHIPMIVGGTATPSLHRLLLAYNGKAHADHALAWAVQLQRDLAAEVIVLSICDSVESCQPGLSLAEIKDRLAQSDLDAYRFLTGEGRPSSEMAVIAAANDVDLIIIGRYRHPAVVEWLAGSTVDRLLRATSLPVLIV